MDQAGERPPRFSINWVGTSDRKREGTVDFGSIVAIAAAIMGARQDQRIHGARHADIAEAAFFFEFFGIQQRARMGEESLFQSGKKDERKLEPLAACRDIRVTRDSGSY